jgi:hypothetical protein
MWAVSRMSACAERVINLPVVEHSAISLRGRCFHRAESNHGVMKFQWRTVLSSGNFTGP